MAWAFINYDKLFWECKQVFTTLSVGLFLNSFQTLPLRFLKSTLSSIYYSLSKVRKTEDNWFLLKPQYLATCTGQKFMHSNLGSSSYFNEEFPKHWILAKELSWVI